MRKKYLLLLLLSVGILLAAAHPALALEVTYPTIGSGTNILSLPADPNFLDFVKYFFGLAVIVSGVIAIISLVISGLQILVSGGNASALTDAKERFMSCILGIALLLASFIILQTINPSLVGPSIDQLPQQAGYGVFLDAIYTHGNVTLNYNFLSNVSEVLAPDKNPNLASPPTIQNPPAPTLRPLLNDGAYYQIRYKCKPPAPVNGQQVAGQRLLVSTYTEPDFKIDPALNGTADVNTFSLPCNESNNNFVRLRGTKSYTWALETPGVYFYLKPMTGVNFETQCQTPDNNARNLSCPLGVSSDVYTNPRLIDGGFEPENFQFRMLDNTRGNPVSMRIVNDRDKQYAVVLNESPGVTPLEECSQPYFNTNIPQGTSLVNSAIINIKNNWSGRHFLTKYATVFTHIPAIEGGELHLFTQTRSTKITADQFYDQENRRAYRLPGEFYGDINKLLGTGDPIAPGIIPGNECGVSASCLKYTESSGGFYRIILYGGNENNWSNLHCQMYTCQNNNFNPENSNRWIFNNSEKVYDMYIVPMPRFACGNS